MLDVFAGVAFIAAVLLLAAEIMDIHVDEKLEDE